MKNIIITFCVMTILVSCTNEESIELDYPFDIQLEPSMPGLLYPTNELTCTNFDLEFTWFKSSTDLASSVTYRIEIASEETFGTILFQGNTSQTSKIFTLEKGVNYFWRVKAIDNFGNESRYTQVQSFFTEPEVSTNTVPSISSSGIPSNGTIVTENTTKLSWSASDSDNDPLRYDVYFGESNPPLLFAENIDTMTMDVQVESNKTYYWRVVAKDSNQAAAISRVWSFITD